MTAAQLRVVVALREFVFDHGYSPTIDELRSALDLSKSTIHQHLFVLREKRLVSWVDGQARTLLPAGVPGRRWHCEDESVCVPGSAHVGCHWDAVLHLEAVGASDE